MDLTLKEIQAMLKDPNLRMIDGLTVRQAAIVLSRSEKTINAQIDKGKLATKQTGDKRRLIEAREVIRYAKIHRSE
ncbi:hypothetical protein K8I61_17370 [bacterium]|nr:hypothetical protein [bacterium]